MTKAQINRVRAATFTAIKKELADEWNALPQMFYIYRLQDSKKAVVETITATTQINNNHIRELGLDPQTAEVKKLYTVNKQARQAF